MNAIAISAVIGAVAVILSTVISVFIAGIKWGNVETKVNLMSDRLARIEGMFTLTLRGREDKSKEF